MAAKFATAGYVLIEDAIAGSDLESLKRELEMVVATAGEAPRRRRTAAPSRDSARRRASRRVAAADVAR